MIFDDAANIMNMESDRVMSQRTGLSRDKIRRIAMGLPFILDYNTYFAFQRLGYEIKILPKLEERQNGAQSSYKPKKWSAKKP